MPSPAALPCAPAEAPARAAHGADTPWIPLSPGRAFKPIRFFADERGYVGLMRVDPGTVVPRHRHLGEVHAYGLDGWRELAGGERVGPGDYVYEPAGNVDHWRAVGDAPAVVMVVVIGGIEYLGPDDRPTSRVTAASMEALYRRWCGDNGVAALDLTE